MRRRGVETRMVIPGEAVTGSRTDPGLLRALARSNGMRSSNSSQTSCIFGTLGDTIIGSRTVRRGTEFYRNRDKSW